MKIANKRTLCLLAFLVATPLALADQARDTLKAAHKGDVVAMRKIGYMKFSGKGTKQDRKNGLAWLKKAAENDDTQAMYYLSIIYADGSYVGQDMKTAKDYLQEAAMKGHGKAKDKLMELFPAEAASLEWMEGKKCVDSSNFSEAYKHFKVSAELGHAGGQLGLGVCYERGQGTEKDLAEAVKWYKKSAEQGNAVAQLNLGICYLEGSGTAVNVMEGVIWLQKAAGKGIAEAQYALGCCYLAGDGVARNTAEAKKWFRAAAKQGHIRASEKLNDL